MTPDPQNGRRSPAAGLTLVEVMVAMTVLILVGVSVCVTMVRGMQHRQESFRRYRAITALRDLVAEVQETANLPQKLSANEGVGSIFKKYNGLTVPVSELPSGQIVVSCFADETSVPADLGGPQDLNFDGDAQDDLGSLGTTEDLKLVPMTLTLTFIEDGQTQTQVLDRLITQTAE